MISTSYHILKTPNPALAALASLALCALLSSDTARAAKPDEVLRYELTWNGQKAGHGNVAISRNAELVDVVVFAVSDGVVKSIAEIWCQVNSTFAAKTLKPASYRFQLKSNLLASEVVDLSFDQNKGLVAVNKHKRDEHESHVEQIGSAYDPLTAAFLLRSQKDLLKPMYVDIYDGKARARLFVTPGGQEQISVQGGTYPACRLGLRLVRLTGDKGEVGKALLWISDDEHRIPLLLKAPHITGMFRFELVSVER